jgi:hypothetical protein
MSDYPIGPPEEFHCEDCGKRLREDDLRCEVYCQACADKYSLTPSEAAELYEHLSGSPLRRQRIQQWCERGDIASKLVTVTRQERRIPRSEIERLVREGLPDRGAGGRPRKDRSDE